MATYGTGNCVQHNLKMARGWSKESNNSEVRGITKGRKPNIRKTRSQTVQNIAHVIPDNTEGVEQNQTTNHDASGY